MWFSTPVFSWRFSYQSWLLQITSSRFASTCYTCSQQIKFLPPSLRPRSGLSNKLTMGSQTEEFVLINNNLPKLLDLAIHIPGCFSDLQLTMLISFSHSSIFPLHLFSVSLSSSDRYFILFFTHFCFPSPSTNSGHILMSRFCWLWYFWWLSDLLSLERSLFCVWFSRIDFSNFIGTVPQGMHFHTTFLRTRQTMIFRVVWPRLRPCYPFGKFSIPPVALFA